MEDEALSPEWREEVRLLTGENLLKGLQVFQEHKEMRKVQAEDIIYEDRVDKNRERQVPQCGWYEVSE